MSLFFSISDADAHEHMYRKKKYQQYRDRISSSSYITNCTFFFVSGKKLKIWAHRYISCICCSSSRVSRVRNFVRAICTYARAVIIFGFGCVNININMLIVFFTLKNIHFHDVKISCKYARIWIKCDQAYRRTSAMYKYC